MSLPDEPRPVRLRGATLPGGGTADVVLRGPLIASVGAPAPGPAAPGDVDLTGYLLLPAPVEVHAHLDKAFTADRVANPAGDLMGAVHGWLRYRPTMTEADIRSRARSAVHAYAGHGATAVRTHVDIGADIGLRALDAVLAVRAEVAEVCQVQVVAFAATPLTGRAGAANLALLRDALAAGADAAGACPGLDDDPAAAIDLCLSAAAAHGVPVDLHVDEWLDTTVSTLDILADAVLATGFPHGVVAGHCVSLSMMDPARTARVAARVAEAGIAVACLPPTNLYLQGRDQAPAAPRGLTAVRALREAGVTVAAGGDNLQDPFNPLGRADPLDAAALLVLAGHDEPAAAYAAVSADGRRALGLPEVSIMPGAPAELLAIQAGSVREAIATATPDRVVIHAGRVVARTSVTRSVAGEPWNRGDHGHA